MTNSRWKQYGVQRLITWVLGVDFSIKWYTNINLEISWLVRSGSVWQSNPYNYWENRREKKLKIERENMYTHNTWIDSQRIWNATLPPTHNPQFTESDCTFFFFFQFVNSSDCTFSTFEKCVHEHSLFSQQRNLSKFIHSSQTEWITKKKCRRKQTLKIRIGFIYWGKMFCSHFMNVCL